MSKEKKEKHRKEPSFLIRALSVENKPVLGLYIVSVIFAVILDILRIIKNLIVSILVVILVASIILGSVFYMKAKPIYNQYMAEAKAEVDKTDPTWFRQNETTQIYDKNGKKISDLTKDQNADYLAYDDIPDYVVEAFVSIEDRTFWTNVGIDPKGIGRVAIQAVKTKGQELHGASTITQQLARTMFLNRDVNLDRKLKEMALAIGLTHKYSKQQIMEFYVNTCYFANSCYGIEAAAQTYFGKSAKDLDLAQTAYLCAIPNSPTYYDPYTNPDRAETRKKLILEAMQEMGYISEADCKAASEEKVTVSRNSTVAGSYATTYAMDCAVRYFMRLDGFSFRYYFDSEDDYESYQKDYAEEYDKMTDELRKGGYVITTTLDSKKQEEMQKLVLDYISKCRKSYGFDDFESAVVVMDKKGKVSAIIGGTGDSDFGLNRAYQAYRQPGSTIKPLVVYTPALENGYTPNTIVTNIDINAAKKLLSQNSKLGLTTDLSDLGGVKLTLRSALEQSLNGVAYSVMYKVGVDKCTDKLRQLEFNKIVPSDDTLSTALGGLTYGATPVEMAGGYAALANGGVYNEPTCISSIKDRYGKEMYTEQEGIRVYRKDAAANMADMMKGVAKVGTARRLNWYESSKKTLYCKTGTTDDKKDGWMCGWCDDSVLTVWAGCDMPKAMPGYGAQTAGALFKTCMLAASE